MEALAPQDPPRLGPYRLTHLLGTGGMGRAYLGRTASGRRIVVKAIRPEHVRNPQFRTRFAREVRAARKVGGFYTAQVIDADTEAEEPWIASAYIPGPSLWDRVTLHGPLDPQDLRILASGLAEGLRAIHGHNLSHRDLKPRNVLLADDGPRIIDFGLSYPSDEPRITQTGALVGTPAYMAPEQTEGVPAEPSADLFSLGTVLYFAATGTNPFAAPTLPATIRRLISPAPDVPSRVPERIGELITRCWRLAPNQRPDINEVLDLVGEVDLDGVWPPHRVRRTAGPPVTEGSEPDTTSETVSGAIAGSAPDEGRADASRPAGDGTLVLAPRPFPPPAPEVLRARVTAFEKLVEKGRYSEAIPGLERLLHQVRARLGGESSLRVLNLITTCRMQVEDFGAAADALRESLPLQVRKSDDEPWELLEAKALLCVCLEKAGDHEDELDVLRELHSERLHLLGPDHPDTLQTHERLAQCLWRLQSWEEALESCRSLLPGCARVFGETHLITLDTRHRLLDCIGRLGKPEDALHGLRELLPRMEKAEWSLELRREPRPLAVEADIVRWQAAAGDLESALRQYEEILPRMIHRLGEEHPDTSSTREWQEHFTAELIETRMTLHMNETKLDSNSQRSPAPASELPANTSGKT